MQIVANKIDKEGLGEGEIVVDCTIDGNFSELEVGVESIMCNLYGRMTSEDGEEVPLSDKIFLVNELCTSAIHKIMSEDESNKLNKTKQKGNKLKTEAAKMMLGETDKNVEIIVILDRSGSMSGMEGDVIGGYNTFIEKQKAEEGSATVTLVIFDNEYKEVYKDLDISEVPVLDSTTYFPRGVTAMYDAIGKAISTNTSENAMVLIQTDGYENSSTEYDKTSVKALLDQKEKLGWDILFLGADIDTAAEGGKMGIMASKSMGYEKNSRGISDAFTNMSNVTANYRASI